MSCAARAQPRTVFVTTSWDDGHRLDARLAELLVSHAIAGTFYIAPGNCEFPARDLLGPAGWRELAGAFEIGGHTLTHRRLTSLTIAEADADIRAGKARLEEATGAALTSFCYPGGRYRPEHVALLKRAGFRGARTVRRLSTRPVTDAFRMRTTVQARPHVRDWPAMMVLAGGHPLRRAWCTDWSTLARTMFDRVLEDGGVFHLWGHSWEIDRYRHWDRLAHVLEHIGRRPGVTYTTNAGLLAAAPADPVVRP